MFRIIAVSVLLCVCSFMQIQAQSSDTAVAVSVSDTLKKTADTNASEAVNTKPNGSELSVNDDQELEIGPLTFDSSGVGALRINVYPEDADVYINTVLVGKGDRFLKKLKSGVYSVRLETKTNFIEDYAFIKNGGITQFDRNVERPTRFVVETSWAYFFDNGGKSIGPSADLGIQYKNQYFGIDYIWGVIDEVNVLGGAGLKYNYRFNFRDILSIAPGVMGGFWYSNNHEKYYSYPTGYEVDRYHEQMYFGGIGCKFNFGYKWVFFNFESDALFGTSVSCLLKAGASFRL